MTPTPANDNRPAWFDALLTQYKPFIEHKCGRYRPGDSEDLYQDVMLAVIEQWGKYRHDGNFVGWLDYVIRYTHYRKYGVDKRRKEYPFYNPPEQVPPSQEHAVIVADAMAKLSDNQREAVSLITMGHDGAEAGKIMGISKQRVWQLVGAARKRLAANDNQRKAA